MKSTFKKLAPDRDGWCALRSETMAPVRTFNSRRECDEWVADWNGDSNFYVARYYLVGAMRR